MRVREKGNGGGKPCCDQVDLIHRERVESEGVITREGGRRTERGHLRGVKKSDLRVWE